MEELIAKLVTTTTWLVPIVILAGIVLPQAMRILREYERGVIFRLGKLLDAKGPGLIFLIPVIDRMVKMDLRVVTIDVARQEVMTRDNVPATVDAVVYFRVVDPVAAVVKVENYWKATSLIAQTTLRSVLGQAPLDDLLAQRESINLHLQEIIDRQTEPWGIKVTAVEVKDVALPDSMKRAMAGFVGPKDIFRNPESLFRQFEPTKGGSPFELVLSHSGDDFTVMGMHFKLGLYEHQSAGALQGLIDIAVANPDLLKTGAIKNC